MLEIIINRKDIKKFVKKGKRLKIKKMTKQNQQNKRKEK